MSTMISFADNKLCDHVMTKDELMKACPSAFKSEPTNPNVSNKYIMATTMDVVNDLEKLGWYPVQAKQCRMKKNSSGIRSFHMIAFQNPDVKIVKPNGDGTETVDAYPRIILSNSHDGFNSFKFMCGLYRLVCSNGLVVCSSEFANMAIRHINYNFDTLRAIVGTAIEQVPVIVNTMNDMRHVILDDEQKKEIATEMYKIRKEVKEDEKFNIDEQTIMDILNPVRNEDKSDDLWTVFNVCQEKMIKGGFSATNDKQKTRKQRGITSIKKDVDFNQKLWAVAVRYLPEVATVNA